MSSSASDDRIGEATGPEAPLSGLQVSSLTRDLTAHLTVIIGHAQLLRRRTRHLADEDAATLDRSLAAIETAARRIDGVLRNVGESMSPHQPRGQGTMDR